MKKLIAIVLALVCMLCFVGCSMFTTDVSWTDKDIKNAKSVEINCYDIQLSVIYVSMCYLLASKIQTFQSVYNPSIPLFLSDRWGWLLTGFGSPCVAQRV